MKKSRRTAQVGDVVRIELSEIIRRELNDPELSFLSVTEVEVTTDLRFARVFVSTLGDESQQDRAVASLQKAKSKLRHLLSQRATLRYTPELEFKSDTTSRTANSIEKLLGEVLPKAASSGGEVEGEPPAASELDDES